MCEVGDRRRGGFVCWCIVVFVFCVESDGNGFDIVFCTVIVFAS